MIARLNEQFGDEDFTPAQKESFVESTIKVMLENPTLVTQAATNSLNQFAESPDLKTELLASVADNAGAQQKMTDFFFSDNPNVDVIIGSLANAFHAAVRHTAQAGRT